MMLNNIYNTFSKCKLMLFGQKHTIKPTPWITFSSREFLDKYLKKDMNIFEWGSGGSTLYFLERVKKVVSIEHNKNWYKKVLKEVCSSEINNCKLILIEPIKKVFNSEEFYKSGDDRYKNYSFKNYCEYIDKFPNRYFDIILIDGRSRIYCVKHSINKVKKNGIIILDNSERDSYSEAGEILKKEGFVETKYYGNGPLINYKWQTSIFSRE